MRMVLYAPDSTASWLRHRYLERSGKSSKFRIALGWADAATVIAAIRGGRFRGVGLRDVSPSSADRVGIGFLLGTSGQEQES